MAIVEVAPFLFISTIHLFTTFTITFINLKPITIISRKIINESKNKILISGQDLNIIQTDLSKRQYESFDRIITAPLKDQVPIWLNKLYPVLKDDIEDLSIGVLRRIRYNIKKMEAPLKEYDLYVKAIQFLKIECEASLPTPDNIQKNFGLTKQEFTIAVDQLKSGNEDLIEKVYLAHLEKCVAIVSKKTNCSKQIAYDCTIDALLEIRIDLTKGRIRYGNLQSYFTTRALNKYFKKEQKKKIIVTQLPESIEFYDELEDTDELVEREFREMVRDAVRKLCDDCSYLLRQFYFEEIKMQDIAKEMNKTHQAVRKQASRCREKLKNHIGEKFYKQFMNH